MTHMKVQKLVFFLHVWSLTLKEKSFVSERPAAWQYGPVFESLYHALKVYGPKEIGNYITVPRDGKDVALVPAPQDTAFYDLLEQVWNRYAKFNALQLSTLTHESGGPWEKFSSTRSEISDQSIIDFYGSKLLASPQHG